MVHCLLFYERDSFFRYLRSQDIASGLITMTVSSVIASSFANVTFSKFFVSLVGKNSGKFRTEGMCVFY